MTMESRNIVVSKLQNESLTSNISLSGPQNFFITKYSRISATNKHLQSIPELEQTIQKCFTFFGKFLKGFEEFCDQSRKSKVCAVSWTPPRKQVEPT